MKSISTLSLLTAAAISIASGPAGTWVTKSQGGKATLLLKVDHRYKISDPKTGPTPYDTGVWSQKGNRVVLTCKPTDTKGGTPQPQVFSLSADGKKLKPADVGLPTWTKRGK